MSLKLLSRIAAAGLLFVAAGASARAEDKAPSVQEAPPEERVLQNTKPGTDTTSTLAVTTSPGSVTTSTNSPSTAGGAPLPAAGSALLDLSNRETHGATTSSGRQVGPETTIKDPPIRSLDERGGALRYLVKEPKPGNLLQLINPFAPMSLGQGGRLVNQWSPIDGGAPVPRAFRDERTHEPMGILIGWP